MFRLNIRNALLGTCAMVALTAAASTGAQAQTHINGGGSSLAQPTYISLFNQYTSTIDNTVAFFYGGGGSGAGQRAVLCASATSDIGSTILGFPSPSAGDVIHFGASDAVLSQTQIDRWNASANVADSSNASCATTATGGTIGATQGGPLIQVPTFGTPITVAFNLPAPLSLSGRVKLTDDQICGIFSGKITNWNDPLLGTTVAASLPNLAIKVVYRSDNSGTTFLFTQHLGQVCTAANTAAGTSIPGNAGVQGFATLFPGGVPANFQGGPQNTGVQAAIGLNATNNGGTASGTSGAVGYLSPDYTTIAPLKKTQTTQWPPVAQVQNKNNGTYYLPNVANTVAALANGAVPTTATDLKNPLKYVPAIGNPSSGYPIAGYTVWILPTCYNDPNVQGTVQTLLSEIYNDVNFIGTIQQNGFTAVPSTGSPSLLSQINNNILSNNPATNVDIGNATACAGKVGR